MASNPSSFLKSALGHSIIVKLSDGSFLKGILATLDPLLNLVLESAEEIGYSRSEAGANGEFKVETSTPIATGESYKKVFVRGNNVVHLRIA